MSSDTSEDEHAELLREAVDTQFINDDMYNQAASKKPKQKPETVQHLPSLRPSMDKDDQFNTFGVTPQFQKYVAKQLSSLLDAKLQKRLSDEAADDVPHKRKKGGIKLFRDSTKHIKLGKSAITNGSSQIRRRNNKSPSESDIETKCSEVAVNPKDILDKKDVKNWSNRSKAEIFRYKKSQNGALILLK